MKAVFAIIAVCLLAGQAAAQVSLSIGGSTAQAGVAGAILAKAATYVNKVKGSVYKPVGLPYEGTGSGTGRANANSGAYDLGFSDTPQGSLGTLQLVYTIGTIGIIVGPGSPKYPMTPQQLARVFYGGDSLTWVSLLGLSSKGDLKKYNIGVVAFCRSDSSGSSNLLSTYMYKSGASSNPGSSTPAFSSTVSRRAGSPDMLAAVAGTTGSIGYADTGLAKVYRSPSGGKVSVLSLKANGGADINPYSIDLNNLDNQLSSALPTAAGDWTGISLVYVPGNYPIAFYGYMLVKQDQSDKGSKGCLTKALAGFFLSSVAQGLETKNVFGVPNSQTLAKATSGFMSMMGPSNCGTTGLPGP